MASLTDLLAKAARLFRYPYQKMDEGRLKAFVISCLEHRDVFIGLVKEHGSPLYVLDEGRLRSQAKRFRQVFEDHLGSVDVFFAMKSNNLPDISRIMVEEGMGLDVSSGVELAQAREVGATRIFFSGPGKTGEELTAATTDFVKPYLRLSAEVLRKTKKALKAGLMDDLEPSLKVIEDIYLNELMETGDAREGLNAFMEKRKPQWRNE